MRSHLEFVTWNDRSRSLAAVLLCVIVVACAFVPKTNPRLEEARAARNSTIADAQLTRLAPGELQRGNETLTLAEHAWNTLDDVAVVDHLAYLAKQRFAIAREIAQRRQAEEALDRMLAEQQTAQATGER